MAKLTRTKTCSYCVLDRPVVIHVCKDGTITYRRQGQPTFNNVALPVYSVATEAQAQAVQVRFGRRQYGEHDRLPGQPWYRWTDFSGDVDALDDVSKAIHAFYTAHLAQDDAAILRDRARKVIAAARHDLGLSVAGLADLLLDNLPELQSVAEARALLAEIGEEVARG